MNNDLLSLFADPDATGPTLPNAVSATPPPGDHASSSNSPRDSADTRSAKSDGSVDEDTKVHRHHHARHSHHESHEGSHSRPTHGKGKGKGKGKSKSKGKQRRKSPAARSRKESADGAEQEDEVAQSAGVAASAAADDASGSNGSESSDEESEHGSAASVASDASSFAEAVSRATSGRSRTSSVGSRVAVGSLEAAVAIGEAVAEGRDYDRDAMLAADAEARQTRVAKDLAADEEASEARRKKGRKKGRGKDRESDDAHTVPTLMVERAPDEPAPRSALRTKRTTQEGSGSGAGGDTGDLKDGLLRLPKHVTISASDTMALYRGEQSMGTRIADYLREHSNDMQLLTQVDEVEEDNAARKTPASKLSTLMGVYIPCVQNIFGVVLFLELAAIVGEIGIIYTMLIILLCTACTVLTTLSMSAIATNGLVPGGGSYYMISRSLGPEFGGAVGILFFLGTSIAASMYITGVVQAAAAQWPVLVNWSQEWSRRVLGTVVLAAGSAIVGGGVRTATIFGNLSLGAVITVILLLFAGFFSSGAIYPMSEEDDPLGVTRGITGWSSETLAQNVFAEPGVVDYSCSPGEAPAEIPVMSISLFFVKLALFFPSVTGIMAGSNRSDALADPSKSIPIGTLGAILTTTTTYLLATLFFGWTIESWRLLCKSPVVAAQMVWPSKFIGIVGIILSSFGAGIQSLFGAPRLLSAILKDGVLPALSRFFPSKTSGEPLRELGLTAFIAWVFIVIGNGDLTVILPIQTMFFLLCYAFVNVACFLFSFLKLPNWRPSWRYYSVWSALAGLILSFSMMFIANWAIALVSVVIATAIWIYIHYRGAQANWGDGLRGAKVQMARATLLSVDPMEVVHTKNWRPQVLAFAAVDEDNAPRDARFFCLLSQLKKAQGLTIVATVLRGTARKRAPDIRVAVEFLNKTMHRSGLRGFAEVIASESKWDAIDHLIQHSGLGALEPNTVLLGWPSDRHIQSRRFAAKYVQTLQTAIGLGKTVVVARGIDNFPGNTEYMSGTIDIWWILHDGGVLLMLPYLLQQHRVWRNCKLRLFTVAYLLDNSLKMERDLKAYLAQLRIEAEVHVIEMSDTQISDYVQQKTIQITHRRQRYEKLGLKKSEAAEALYIGQAKPSGGVKGGNVEEGTELSPMRKALRGGAGKARQGGDEEGEQDDDDEEEEEQEQEEDSDEGEGAGVHDLLQDATLRHVHSAALLNTKIREQAQDAALVLVNLPSKSVKSNFEYLEYVNTLSEGVDRMLLIRGSGKEVITEYL